MHFLFLICCMRGMYVCVAFLMRFWACWAVWCFVVCAVCNMRCFDVLRGQLCLMCFVATLLRFGGCRRGVLCVCV